MLAEGDRARFWAKVDVRDADECWPWMAGLTYGYGRFNIKRGMSRGAHRLVYELEVGPIPEGLELDHLCRNRACCNPAHLEPVTKRENTLRGESFSAKNAQKTHCERGHPLSGDNLRVRRGWRICVICQRANQRVASRRWRAAQVSNGCHDD